MTHEAEPYMPQNADKIPNAEIELLRKWIEGGARENKSSKAIKPMAKVLKAIEGAPGVRPEVIPLPPRMVLEPHFHTQRAPMASSLATSPWAPLVAVAGQRQVLLYNTASLELVGVFPFPEGQPNVVRFSGDGAFLLAGGGRPAASGKVVVWDIATGERAFEVGDELDAVLAADISADHTQIALGGQQRLVRVYSTDTGKLLYEINKHTDWVLDVEFSPDGALLATADRSGGICLWEARTGNEYLTLNGHTGAVSSLSWRVDSNILASGSEDSSVRLWEPENGKQVKTWKPQGAILSLEFTRDGRLVTAGRDQVVRVWDQAGKQLAASAPMGDLTVSTSHCDESNRLFAGDWKGEVHAYKAEDASNVGRLATNPPTLAERLQIAQQELQEKSAAAQPLDDSQSQADAKVASAQTELDAAQSHVEKLGKEIDELATQANQLSQTRAANDKERIKYAEKLEQIAASRPLISESLRHLTEASEKLPEDAKLTEIFDQLSKRLSGMEAESTELRKKIDDLTVAIDGNGASLTKTNLHLEVAHREAATANERVAAMKKQAAALAAAAESTRQATQAASDQVAEAERQVARWQGEIEFRDRIQVLQAKLQAAKHLAAERQAGVEKADSNLADAQSKVASARSELDQANRSIDQIYAEIGEVREAK